MLGDTGRPKEDSHGNKIRLPPAYSGGEIIRTSFLLAPAPQEFGNCLLTEVGLRSQTLLARL